MKTNTAPSIKRFPRIKDPLSGKRRRLKIMRPTLKALGVQIRVARRNARKWAALPTEAKQGFARNPFQSKLNELLSFVKSFQASVGQTPTRVQS